MMHAKTVVVFVAVWGSVLMGTSANATPYVVYNARIKFFAHSIPSYGEAHMIELAEGTMYLGGDHPQCGHRAYILPEDRTLVAAALVAGASGARVNFYYDDAAPQVTIVGHGGSQCRVFSMWNAP